MPAVLDPTPQAASCALGHVTRKNTSGAAGKVLSQSTKAGSSKPLGAKVNVVVSR